MNIIHGANPINLYRAYNVQMPHDVIDFSSNTNALSCPEIFAHIDVMSLASHYPDPECSRLCECVAEREHIPPSRILFTNGINEAIFLLSQVLTGATAILQPAYSEYARAFTNLHDIYTLDELHGFKNIIIINPNNPTGQYTRLTHIIAANQQTTFIVDEAYTGFLLNVEAERLCDFPNVIILRSLTKIFPLSGARIGYIIAGEDIISRLRERLPTWSVNAFAQKLALSFMNDEGFLERTHDFYSTHTPAFMNSLRKAGFEVINTDVHFFTVRVNDDLQIIRELLKAGLVVRHTRNFKGLDGKFIRVATRHEHENIRLVEALANAGR